MKKASRVIKYKEKGSIRLFLGKDKTLERNFNDKLWECPFWGELKDKGQNTLRLFNNACYICTCAFYDDYPPNNLDEYIEIAIDGHDDSIWTDHIVPATMALVVNWLSSEECIKISEERERREDIEELCRRIRVSIEESNVLPLEGKKDFQALIIQDHQLPSGFINDESFRRNTFSEAMDYPSVKAYDIIKSMGYLIDVIKNNPNELIAAIGPDSHFFSEVQKVSINSDDLQRKFWESLIKKYNDDTGQPQVKETAFNGQTDLPCFTSRQMTILMTAVGRITEKENPPGKTTLGDIVQKIAGYSPTTASQNIRGTIPDVDKKIVADVLKSKFPKLASEVLKVT